MKDRLITAWDFEESTEELYVPSYIIEMAPAVIAYYDMAVSHMEVVAVKEKKGGLIWKMQTDKGPRSLKILHRTPARSLFSLAAQEYLVKKKQARVPGIIPTKDGENYVEKGGKLWFVAEWIEPLAPVSKNLEGAKQLAYALGEFHLISKGYIPPEGAEIASRVNRWPRHYRKIIRKMEWFRDIAQAYSEMPASSSILSVIDMYEKQALDALNRLEQSNYRKLATRGNEGWGLVHQDYGWSNAQMGSEGMWVIDLDSVAYDITIRDLRKFIVETMGIFREWNLDLVSEIIGSYHEANPIDDAQFEVLLIDMELPNEFYGELKYMVYEPTLFLDEGLEQELQQIIMMDKTKTKVLKKLREAWKRGKLL